MHKLDEIALNIELVLISIIEGVALTYLGENAVHVFHSPEALRYFPYVLAGLTILLVFWSQAILHAVSFIRWPLRMEHMLLYFVAAFVQIMAYSYIEDVRLWFLWWTGFSLLTLVIYIVDLRIVRDVRPMFAERGGTDFITEIERRHMVEMKYLVPVAIIFNFGVVALIYRFPALLENPYAYATFGMLQFIVSLGALVDCVRNFKTRSLRLPALFR